MLIPISFLVWTPPPPRGLPCPGSFLSPGQQDAIRRTTNWLRASSAALHDADVLGMCTLVYSSALEVDALPRNRPAAIADLRRCLQVAVTAVLAVEHELARSARALPAIDVGVEHLRQHADQWLYSWHKEYIQIIEQTRREGCGAGLSARNQALYSFAWRMTQLRVQDGATQLRILERASRSAHRRRTGRHPSKTDYNPLSTAADAHLLLGESHRVMSLLVVDSTGRLEIGYRQARDRLREISESPKHPTQSVERADALASHDIDVPEQVQAIELVRTIRDFMAVRSAEAADGSASHTVLLALDQLLDGRVTLTELAQQSGHPLTTLSDAYERERGRLGRQPGVRQAG